ncbi:hypothetical protein SCALM49S_02450 [Streptomyces californicus]
MTGRDERAGEPGAGDGAPETRGGAKPPEVSGVDLARVALRAAKEQARARGAAAQQRKQARRGGACARGPGRTAGIRRRWGPRSTG